MQGEAGPPFQKLPLLWNLGGIFGAPLRGSMWPRRHPEDGLIRRAEPLLALQPGPLRLTARPLATRIARGLPATGRHREERAPPERKGDRDESATSIVVRPQPARSRGRAPLIRELGRAARAGRHRSRT